MALLKAKQKNFLKTAAMYFGIIVIGAAIYRAFRSSATTTNAKVQVLLADLKSILSFGNVILLLVIAGGIVFDIVTGQVAGTALAVALGTLTTGAAVVTTFNTTYVPKFFHYVAATQLTGVKITVQGEGVIFDSDANGLNHAGTNRVFGQVTNGYIFRLANGFIKGKNVIWEFTNSAAQTPVVYVSSDETPAPGQEFYMQLLRQAILANSGQNFTDFATLSLPSLAATDVINMLYRDGTQQQLNRADLQAMLSYTQNVINTPIYLIDNFNKSVNTVNVIAGSAQTAYVQRWVPVASKAMVSQVVNGI